MRQLLIVGCGGHAKVVTDLVRARGDYNVAGFIAHDARRPTRSDIPLLGCDNDLPKLRQQGIVNAVVAVGDNGRRRDLGMHLIELGFNLVTVVSPAATLAPSVQLGAGVVVMAGAVINAESRIGSHVIINTHASVDHDCVVGEAVHLAPGAVLTGNVKIDRLAFIGAAASVIPNVTIGERAIIGAGSCVIRDIPAGATAWGVPAKVMRNGEPR
ncbi:MAG TPA: acetyltransferase [Xanthobacteraceae bacterium]|nr:acetyltransferase [Xanthobacteraceae bacterium]